MKFTGERFVPELEIDSEISIFHRQRYISASMVIKNKRVLDAACGEGYGSAILAENARSVVGIDISEEAVKNAREKYQKKNLSFLVSSVTSIPVADHSIDVVVSFETIEHISEQEQRSFLKEIKRVLTSDGILIMSSPDKKNYSDIPNFHNQYHVHELYLEEFDELLRQHFHNVEHYYQGMFCNSYIFKATESLNAVTTEAHLNMEQEATRSEYNIAICSDGACVNQELSSVVYDSTNRYYKMKDEVLILKERLGDPGKIIEQKENYICEQRDKLLKTENDLLQQNAIIEQKENYICEQRERLLKMENDLRQQNAIIEQKENYICEQREQLLKVENDLNQQNIIVEQKENYICEQREQLLKMENDLHQQNIIIEQKDSFIQEQQGKLNEVTLYMQKLDNRLNKLLKLPVFGMFIRYFLKNENRG